MSSKHEKLWWAPSARPSVGRRVRPGNPQHEGRPPTLFGHLEEEDRVFGFAQHNKVDWCHTQKAAVSCGVNLWFSKSAPQRCQERERERENSRELGRSRLWGSSLDPSRAAELICFMQAFPWKKGFSGPKHTNPLVYSKGHCPGRQVLGSNITPWPLARQWAFWGLPATSQTERLGLGEGQGPSSSMIPSWMLFVTFRWLSVPGQKDVGLNSSSAPRSSVT